MKNQAFFESEESVKALVEEVEGWLGTPFFKSSRAKGKDGGVDCVHLIQEVYFTLGVIDCKYPMPQYSIQWALHQKKSLLKEYIRTFHSKDFEQIDLAEDRQAGDLLLINPNGRCVHHGGIMLNDKWFTHAIARYGVINSPVDGSGYGFVVDEVWRPVLKS